MDTTKCCFARAIAVDYEGGQITPRGGQNLAEVFEATREPETVEMVEELTGWPRSHLVYVEHFDCGGHYMIDVMNEYRLTWEDGTTFKVAADTRTEALSSGLWARGITDRRPGTIPKIEQMLTYAGLEISVSEIGSQKLARLENPREDVADVTLSASLDALDTQWRISANQGGRNVFNGARPSSMDFEEVCRDVFGRLLSD